MKEKRKKLFAKMMVVMICIFILPLGLGGCSLAVEDAGGETGGDRLIGVFITDTFVDTFDTDAYLNENVGKLASGSEFTINENDAAEYSDVVYATIDKKDSDDPSDWDISFPSLTGVRFLCPVFEVDGETYHLNICDPGISAVSMDVNSTDDGEEVSLEAIYYFLPDGGDSDTADEGLSEMDTDTGDDSDSESGTLESENLVLEMENKMEESNELSVDVENETGDALDEAGETNDLNFDTEDETLQTEEDILEENPGSKIFYVNSVWQKADGTIYLTPGDGYMTSGDDVAEGEKMSTILTAESKSTVDGVTVTESDRVMIRFAVMYRPEKITVWQMSAEHAVLASESYEPGEVPEQMTPQADAAYLLVETQKMDSDGNAVVSRDWYERPATEEDGENITTYYAQDGAVAALETAVAW